jgi:hypothetical protein
VTSALIVSKLLGFYLYNEEKGVRMGIVDSDKQKNEHDVSNGSLFHFNELDSPNETLSNILPDKNN